jgi:hypothetical protein
MRIMKKLVKLAVLAIVSFSLSNTALAQTGYVSTAPSASQTVTQPVASGVRTTLGVNSLSNTYYVNQWCSTPGVLDDTCFSNAIADIYANALTGQDGRRMQVLIVSPGVYKFTNTVTVPLGVNISIKGEYQAGIWGSVISPGSASPVDFFHVVADNIEFQHLAFVSGSGITAITLGTSTQATYDTHINWCWFAAIHIVNGGGYDLSHNTFDSGTNYGILSNATLGDISASDIIATDLRGYGQISTVAIVATGKQGPSYQGYIFSGIFDHSVGNAAPIALANVIGAKISGIFNNNHYNDVNINGCYGVIFSDFHVYNPGQTSIFVNNSNGVQITNGVIYNSNTVTAGTPMISVTTSGNTTVSNITSLNAGITQASVGLYVDASTGGSTIYGNNFNAQTGSAYNVLDGTAGLNVQGTVNATHITASNGYSGTKTMGSCTLTIAGGIITNVSGC